MNKLNNEYKEINDKLNKINEEIDEDKMDEKILVNYAEEFDTNYEKTLNENLEEEIMDLCTEITFIKIIKVEVAFWKRRKKDKKKWKMRLN